MKLQHENEAIQWFCCLRYICICRFDYNYLKFYIQMLVWHVYNSNHFLARVLLKITQLHVHAMLWVSFIAETKCLIVFPRNFYLRVFCRVVNFDLPGSSINTKFAKVNSKFNAVNLNTENDGSFSSLPTA